MKEKHGSEFPFLVLGRALKLAPVTRQAAISPIAGPNLKPSPAKPPTTMTSGSAGCTPTTKSCLHAGWGVRVDGQPFKVRDHLYGVHSC